MRQEARSLCKRHLWRRLLGSTPMAGLWWERQLTKRPGYLYLFFPRTTTKRSVFVREHICFAQNNSNKKKKPKFYLAFTFLVCKNRALQLSCWDWYSIPLGRRILYSEESKPTHAENATKTKPYHRDVLQEPRLSRRDPCTVLQDFCLTLSNEVATSAGQERVPAGAGSHSAAQPTPNLFCEADTPDKTRPLLQEVGKEEQPQIYEGPRLWPTGVSSWARGNHAWKMKQS